MSETSPRTRDADLPAEVRRLAWRVRALNGYRRDPEHLALERADIAERLLWVARRLEAVS